jgi:hypothetical protein
MIEPASHATSRAGGAGQAQPAAGWLAQGLAALDERVRKAQTEQFTVKSAGDLAYAVMNGDGISYTVEFRTARTGTCNCPDFEKRGKSLATCKHIIRVVVVAWPSRLDAYLDLVRSHIQQAVEHHAARSGATSDEAAQAAGDGIRPGAAPLSTLAKVEEGHTGASKDDLDEANRESDGVQGTIVTAQTSPDLTGAPAASASFGLYDLEAVVTTATSATLDGVMHVLQEMMPEIVQRVIEEVFARLMERVPAVFEASLAAVQQAHAGVRVEPAAESGKGP